MNPFEKLLDEKSTLLADGATGTSFFAMGLQSGDAPELWNVDYPERVVTHYQSFIDAGSDLVLTNSFGGTRYRLQLHKAEHRVAELNIAAAALLGKENLEYLFSRLGGWFKNLVKWDQVSPRRYGVGVRLMVIAVVVPLLLFYLFPDSMRDGDQPGWGFYVTVAGVLIEILSPTFASDISK